MSYAIGVFRACVTALWMCAVNAAHAQAEAPLAKLPSGAVQIQATGRIELHVETDSPLAVEFERSEPLTRALADAMQAKGFVITQDRAAAKATLVIRGDVVLLGGPRFYKGVKVAMGEATEKALMAAAEGPTISPAEDAQVAVSLALESSAAKSAISPFWRGLALSRMADVLGDATGARGAFNKALTGDPRGICLSRCDDWNKVKQTAYAFVSLTTAQGRQDIRVLATVNLETLAPEEVVDQALSRAIAAIEVTGSASVGK